MSSIFRNQIIKISENNEEFTRLLTALEDGDVEYIEQASNINLVDKNNNSPLIIACANGHLNIIEILLNKGADINGSNVYGRNCIYIGCKYGYIQIVNFLLEIGADFNKKDTNGLNSLMIASTNGHGTIVQTLCEAGASIDIQDNQGHTALMLAYLKKQSELAKLVELDTVDIQSVMGEDPMYPYNFTLQTLIEHYEFKCLIGVDPNYPNTSVPPNDPIAQEIINRSRILAIFKILYHKFIYLDLESTFELVENLILESLSNSI